VTGVLVVGAGIAGLTTALSLHAAGIECRIVDKARELTPAGVGINLQPHAVRELEELGLGEDLARHGVATAEVVHFDRFGNRIWDEPRGTAAGYRWPQYSIHRGTLQLLLLRAVRRRLGEDAVETGLAFEGCAETPTGVTVRLRTRTGDVVETSADVLIGADGLHSAVRAWLHPGEGRPLGSGIRMWRGTVMAEPFLTGATMIMAGSNSAAKFVAYPITPPADGRTTINWVAEVRMPDDELPADWTTRGRMADVLPHYRDWRFDWLDVPSLIQRSDPILEYPMVDRDPLPWWGTGRITLTGDAAHPMYPIGSNGGSQAVLDARVLAYFLHTMPDPPTALACYEAERREPANKVLLANRKLGPERILSLVATRAPKGFRRIEDVLTREELTEISTAYQNTTSTDVQTLNTSPTWTTPARVPTH
jgi:5-methylphenazine-1-carboxylate 1-monooxygenase